MLPIRFFRVPLFPRRRPVAPFRAPLPSKVRAKLGAGVQILRTKLRSYASVLFSLPALTRNVFSRALPIKLQSFRSLPVNMAALMSAAAVLPWAKIGSWLASGPFAGLWFGALGVVINVGAPDLFQVIQKTKIFGNKELLRILRKTMNSRSSDEIRFAAKREFLRVMRSLIEENPENITLAKGVDLLNLPSEIINFLNLNGGSDPAIIDTLIALVSNRDLRGLRDRSSWQAWRLQMGSWMALRRVLSPTSLEIARTVFSDPTQDPAFREQAACILGIFEGDAAVPMLTAAMKGEDVVLKVRTAAIRALGYSKKLSLLKEAAEAAGGYPPELKEAIGEAMRYIEGSFDIPASVIEKTQEALRARILSRGNFAGTQAWLKGLVKEKKTPLATRIVALRHWTAHMRPKAVWKILPSILNDESEPLQMRIAAAQSLYQIHRWVHLAEFNESGIAVLFDALELKWQHKPAFDSETPYLSDLVRRLKKSIGKYQDIDIDQELESPERIARLAPFMHES